MSSCQGRFYDGGYSGVRQTYDKKKDIFYERNYTKATIENIRKQIKTYFNNLIHVHFTAYHYKKFIIKMLKEHQDKHIICYCDIPYFNTKQYSTNKKLKFDYHDFWQFITDVHKQNDNIQIFVSEYQIEAPECIKLKWQTCWQKEMKQTQHQTNTHIVVEKLFKFN